MATGQDRRGRPAAGASPPGGREAFAESLRQRGQAAKALEKDLVSEVPLLYGSPGGASGDPGIVLERLHQAELVGRHGGGLPPASRRRRDVALPLERVTAWLAILLALLMILGR